MTTRDRWLDEGLRVLSDSGAAGLRIDRLAARLGLSKGSFYHHFAGITAYRLDLLDHFERRYTARYVDAVEAGAGTAAEKLDRLVGLVLADDRPEDRIDVAMRAWAAQDDDAAATQERVDRNRLSYLRGLFAERWGDGPEAVLRSQHMYLLVVGAQHVLPPLSVEEIRRLYAWVSAPDRAGSATTSGSDS